MQNATMTPKPVILCILDGWGLSDEVNGNAVALADTPNFDRLMKNCSRAKLTTHGPAVGLPKGQMGNSEVGHMNIGAGRVVEMDLVRIDRVTREGVFGKLPEVQDLVATVKAGSGRIHLLGVLSDGGVHGHIDHMTAAMGAFSKAGLDVLVHLFSDGRDVPPVSAAGYLERLQNELVSHTRIATLSGRFYAMDRDNRWDRVKPAFDAIVLAHGTRYPSASEALGAARAAELTDEFIEPSVIGNYAGFQDGDGVLMLNFRADRARELLSAIGDPNFSSFEIEGRPILSTIAGFTSYSDDHDLFVQSIFTKPDLTNTLAEWVSAQGKTQFHIAETEKYPHVTFFLNGGRETAFNGEDRYLAPSPQVATYDLKPEMSAEEVTDNLLSAISKRYDLIVVNFANPDMVGHTGDLEAAIKAVEAVDAGLGKMLNAVDKMGSAALICADHGNCETMIDPETGGPHTAHTTNLVPVVLYGASGQLQDGALCDVAPTLLNLMGLTQPPEMTGSCLRVL